MTARGRSAQGRTISRPFHVLRALSDDSHFFLVGIALLAVSFHFLTPDSWHWMAKDAAKTISTLLFSGSWFVFLGLYVKDQL